MTQIYRNQGTIHDIQVIEQRGIRYLRFGDGGGWQGALRLNQQDHLVFPYQRAFAAVLPVLMPQTGPFLSVGVGTGTSLRTVLALQPDAELFGVELDEHVLDVAISYFHAPNHRQATYWVGDGLHFLRAVPNQFDCIFMDVYLGNRIYAPSLEPEVACWLHHRLRPEGSLVCNLIFRFPPRAQLRTFLDAANQLFANILLLPVGWPGTEQNVLAVLSNRPGLDSALRAQLAITAQTSMLERWLWSRRLRSYHPVQRTPRVL